MGYGLRSSLTGVAGGVTGLVQKPILGARQEGVTGFLKGTAKGVGGLLVMPISGAIDFFSKTSEGIKNSVNSGERHVPKIRHFRPFYGLNQQIKVYDEFHAVIVKQLQRISRGIYAKDCFLDAFFFDDTQ